MAASDERERVWQRVQEADLVCPCSELRCGHAARKQREGICLAAGYVVRSLWCTVGSMPAEDTAWHRELRDHYRQGASDGGQDHLFYLNDNKKMMHGAT